VRDNKSISAINSWMLLSICIAAVLLLLTNSIVILGKNIPQDNIVTDYLIGVIWAVMFGIVILLLPTHDRAAIFSVWLAKIFVTLVAMLFYEANYGLDSYYYFSAPRDSNFEWTGFSIGSGSANITNLVWLCYKVMPQSFHALKVTFAMVGLVAIYVFYRAAVMFLEEENIRVLYAIGFFPSILFWSSIFGKDPIALLGISFYTYGVVGWYKSQRLRYLWILGFGILLATFIRSWLGIILLAPMALLTVRSVRGILPKIVLTVLISSALLLAWGALQQQFGLESYEDTLETLDTQSRSWSKGGAGQEVTADFTQGNQAIAFLPLGIFTALFRPLPGEILNPFGLLAGLENFWLLLQLWQAIKVTRWKDLNTPLIQWAVLFVLIWGSAYGFVSYQNLGTAVRFKLQILPVLLGLLLYLRRQRQPSPASKSFVAANKFKK
jgi:hypothetical protein